MRRTMSLTVLMVFSTAVAACGGGTAATTAPAAGGNAVTIANFKFDPQAVSVKAGTAVTWTNTDSTGHSVKWADGTATSEILAASKTYSRTFAAAGTFPYMCGIHASMTGTITVTQ